MPWPVLIFGIIALGLVLSAAYFYLRYARSPEKAWRNRVLRLLAQAAAQARADRYCLEHFHQTREKEERSLREQALSSYLKKISVAELDDFPGIGPATVGKLRDAGYTNLAVLRRARIRVRGLGAKRLADIGAARQELLRQAEARFDAEACPEGLKFRSTLNALESKYQQAEQRSLARARAAEAVMDGIKDAAAVARGVTFLRYFWLDAQALVPPGMVQDALPDLRQAILEAEEEASAPFTEPEEVPEGSGRPGAKGFGPVTNQSPRKAQPVRARSSGGSFPRDTAPPSDPVREVVASESTGRVQARPARAVPHEETPHQADPRIARMELTIQCALAIARADSPVTPKERAVIEARILDRYKQDPALLNRARAYCAHYEAATIDDEACVQRIAALFPQEDRTALVNLVAHLIPQESGGISPAAAKLLEKIARRLGVPFPVLATGTESVDRPADDKVSAGEAAPAVLEIEPSAPLTAELIRRQYHRLSERYAAEKFASLGEEFLAMAKSKGDAIRAAAETLLEPLGERLDAQAAATAPQSLRHNPELDDVFGAG